MDSLGGFRSEGLYRAVMDPTVAADPLRKPHTLVFLTPSMTLLGMLAYEFPVDVGSIRFELHIRNDQNETTAIKNKRFPLLDHPAIGHPRVMLVDDVEGFRALLKQYRELWAADL